MSRADSRDNSPRAVIHKRILDVAESRPDAPLEAIADEVGGATAELVERVFEEYGDPGDPPESTAADDTETAQNGHRSATKDADTEDKEPPTGSATTDGETGESPTTESGASESPTTESETTDAVSPESLSRKQYETLRLVYEHPGWSQSEIAEQIGVSRATVSRRVNDVPGFDWQRREAFTRELFDREPTPVDTRGEPAPVDARGEPAPVDAREIDRQAGLDRAEGTSDGPGDERGDTPIVHLERRLDSLERQVAKLRVRRQSVALPADLAHKVVHACLVSDRISEDEELQLLKTLVGDEPRSR